MVLQTARCQSLPVSYDNLKWKKLVKQNHNQPIKSAICAFLVFSLKKNKHTSFISSQFMSPCVTCLCLKPLPSTLRVQTDIQGFLHFLVSCGTDRNTCEGFLSSLYLTTFPVYLLLIANLIKMEMAN